MNPVPSIHDQIEQEATALLDKCFKLNLVAEYPDRIGFGPIARKDLRETLVLLKRMNATSASTLGYIESFRTKAPEQKDGV